MVWIWVWVRVRVKRVLAAELAWPHTLNTMMFNIYFFDPSGIVRLVDAPPSVFLTVRNRNIPNFLNESIFPREGESVHPEKLAQKASIALLVCSSFRSLCTSVETHPDLFTLESGRDRDRKRRNILNFDRISLGPPGGCVRPRNRDISNSNFIFCLWLPLIHQVCTDG